MFEFLGKVFGRPYEVEVVGYEEPEVIMTSEKPLKIGVVDVHALIAGVKIRGRVQVVETGEEHSRGLWVDPAEAVPYLEEIFAVPEKRRLPRFPRKLRVRSTQFTGFQGHTLDLSEEGMRAEGPGVFAPGQTMEIRFELDDDRITEVQTKAAVRWCAPALTEGWSVVGLSYLEFNPATSSEHSYYMDFLKRLASDPDIQPL